MRPHLTNLKMRKTGLGKTEKYNNNNHNSTKHNPTFDFRFGLSNSLCRVNFTNNFTNILCAAFLYKNFAPSFFVLKF
jgi:hypothetical protein